MNHILPRLLGPSDEVDHIRAYLQKVAVHTVNRSACRNGRRLPIKPSQMSFTRAADPTSTGAPSLQPESCAGSVAARRPDESCPGVVDRPRDQHAESAPMSLGNLKALADVTARQPHHWRSNSCLARTSSFWRNSMLCDSPPHGGSSAESRAKVSICLRQVATRLRTDINSLGKISH